MSNITNRGFPSWVLLGSLLFPCICRAELSWLNPDQHFSGVSGRTLVAVYEFYNQGPMNAQITAVIPSCDCLKIKEVTKNLGPGGYGQIRLELPMEGREGHLERTILVKSDSPKNPEVTLRLTVDVPQAIAGSPQFLFWKIADAPIAKSIDISVVSSSIVQIEKASTSGQSFKLDLERSDSAAGYRLKVTPVGTNRTIQSTIRLNAIVDGHPQVLVFYAAVR